MEREVGTVKWFGPKLPYGYIIREDGNQIYVHYKNILPDNQPNPRFRTLEPMQIVTFEEGSAYFTVGSQALKVRVEHVESWTTGEVSS